MQGIQQGIQYILDFGPSVWLPLIMLIIGVILRMRFGEAFGAALTFGVAFAGMSLVIGYILGAISPAAKQMVERTGLELRAVDLGWTPAAAISWAWPYAALMFPVQIVINLAMLALGWTEVLNVDMWNVWHKATIGAFIVWAFGSLPLAFVVAAIWVVMELKCGDLIKERVYGLTGIPGMTVPHPNMLSIVWYQPILWVLNRIPGLEELRTDPQTIRDRIGVFGENHVIGFVVGGLIAILAGYDAQGILTTAIQSAAALTLFPMVARLFMQALSPFADAAEEFMRDRFPDRRFYIGVDWPVLAGDATLWTAAILAVPIALVLAVVLPGNVVMPFGSLVIISYTMNATVATQSDLLKTYILALIHLVPGFYIASYFAPFYTELASEAGFEFPEGAAQITWLTTNADVMRVALFRGIDIFFGNLWPGILLLPLMAACWWLFVRLSPEEEKKAVEESGGLAAARAGGSG